MSESSELRYALVRNDESADFELVELRKIGSEGEAGIVEFFAVGEREAFQRCDGFTGSDAVGCIKSVAKLEILQRQCGEVFKTSGCGVLGANFETFELGKFREVDSTYIGEFGVSEADTFEIRQALAEGFQAFVVDAAAAMTHFSNFAPVGALGVGLASDRGADKGKGFEAGEACKGFHACIGEFAVVGETQCFEVRELSKRRDPFIIGFGGDDIEGFK